jgi:hypothetical protein
MGVAHEKLGVDQPDRRSELAVMTKRKTTNEWTRRKTTDLLRLLKEYKRNWDLPEWSGVGPGNPGELIDATIRYLGMMESSMSRDDRMLLDLSWWCDIVRDRYGMKRHTAIKWLMQQYCDKEGVHAFTHNWGASVDSTARRFAQKMVYYKPPYRQDRTQYAAALNEDGVDIYQLTFKLLKLWREPGSV